MEKINKNLKALLNLKPVIAAALITAASSTALALFSSDVSTPQQFACII